MKESLRRISGGQSTWGHHRNILRWFYENLNFHDFQLFRARIFHLSQSSKYISKNIFQQARSAPGSEVRGLAHALRRLYLSIPPMGQLRGEWRRPENCVTASSRPNQSSKIKDFDCTLLGANTPKRSCTIMGPTLEKAPTSR